MDRPVSYEKPKEPPLDAYATDRTEERERPKAKALLTVPDLDLGIPLNSTFFQGIEHRTILASLPLHFLSCQMELDFKTETMWKRGNKSKAWIGSQNGRLPILITFLILCSLFLIFIFHDDTQKTNLSLGLPKQRWNSFESLVQMHPTVEFRNGTNIIWQIPDSPNAVLFLAHGCNGQAFNFWDRSPHCPKCVGLPEERLIVLHALAQNFAVLTISSAGRCWTYGRR
ncbi:hypothetical protein FNV43_RR13177 [Rhamnella rubrinervis]|uniref:Uncharacterized protein n=1 Tax=Rhamnella rubrinervis TaxID=2594499 RepID=A0A8K0MDR8_9ROSA|nr:hypothetical protein FNV43_RR13177 [Rhamnella rubrinervis]